MSTFDGYEAEAHPRSYRAPDLWEEAGITAADLDALDFPPIKWIVPGLIAEGCTLLAGRPKLGKSWLCLDVALAVASEGEALGQRVEAGDVLYLALEDNRRRLQSRIRRVWPSLTPFPARLRLMTEWRTGSEGVAEIRRWIDAHPDARLVIVDVLQKFKGSAAPGSKATLYELDYAALSGLQSLASRTGVAIVVVHHTRKSAAEEDPFEKVSGTLGLSGAADTTIILDRDGQGCTLYGRGRDVEEFETAVSFDKTTCRWRALGEAAEVRRSDERAVILALLADNREGMTPAEIADALGLPRNNVKQLVFKMMKAGEVDKGGRKGCYVHPDHAPSPTPDNSDNRDNRARESEGHHDPAAVGMAGYRLPRLSPSDACAHCGKLGADTDATDGTLSARIHRDCFDAWLEVTA